MNKIFKNKKFKYGSLGVGFTVTVIALLVVINVIVYTLVYGLGWYFDMTSEKMYNISDSTRAKLDTIDGELNDITIYFMSEADKLSVGATSSNYSAQSMSNLWGMRYIHSLANELADEYSFIKCDYIDLSSEPDRIKEIVGEEYYNAANFSASSVLIDNYTVERESDGTIINGVDGKPLYRHNFRLYSRNSFYSFDYTSASYYFVSAFKGDYRFCSSILSICETTIPTAYFISGHGEDIGAYTVGKQDASYNLAQQLWQLFVDSGYEVKKINLQYENFANEPNAVAVIFSPSTDYSGNSALETNSELGKIDAFLQTSGHSLMVLLDYEARELPNLEGYLESNYGVKYENAQIKDNGENSIDVSMLTIAGRLENDSSLSGYALTESILQKQTVGKSVFNSARPIKITDSAKAGSVVYAPTSAYAEYTDGTRESYSEVSPASLMTLSAKSEGSYVICMGSSYAANTVYADSGIYENRNLILSAIDLMSNEEVPLNIEYKNMDNNGLDLTKREAITATVILSAAVPLVVLVIGLIVYIRRRHS